MVEKKLCSDKYSNGNFGRNFDSCVSQRRTHVDCVRFAAGKIDAFQCMEEASIKGVQVSLDLCTKAISLSYDVKDGLNHLFIQHKLILFVRFCLA